MRVLQPRRLLAIGAAAAMSVTLVSASHGAAQGPEDSDAADDLSLAEVTVSSDAERQALMDSGLDVIEVSDSRAELLLHGERDEERLAAGGWPATVSGVEAELADLDAARAAERELAEQVAAGAAPASDLPTGRVSYRTLDEAEAEMRELAELYPDKVELFELPEPSLLGHPVLGMEITADVDSRAGKPVFLTSGLHHAREWPTLEFTMEFAWDVLEGYGTDDRVTELIDSTRMIVVPAVNPDGYTISRDRIHEMKRKNCRVEAGAEPTYDECAAAESESLGVDLNRNYASFWGGPGSSADPTEGNHHGASPHSEPEIQNMVELMNANQVVVAMHNHTPDERLLRAPSSPLEPEPAEVEMYDGLAQTLGDALGWPAGPWTEIYYDASGVAEQHGLYGYGTFGFTPELTPGHSGLERFHPPYEYVIDQYHGTGFYEGSSIREALLLAWEATADPQTHSVLTGSAPAGAELTISKAVTVDSSPLEHRDDEVLETDVDIETTMRVPDDGAVEWHVLPSNRQDQYASKLMEESWMVSCVDAAGDVAEEDEVSVARGESTEVDLSDWATGASIVELDELLREHADASAGTGRGEHLLDNRLSRAVRHLDAGREHQTTKALEQFIRFAERPALVPDDDARDELVDVAEALIDVLSE